MLYNRDSGKRMFVVEPDGKTPGELKPFLDKFNADFKNKPEIMVLRAKEEHYTPATKFRANQVVDGKTDASGSPIKMAPRAGKVSPFGSYVNDEGQKINVIFSETAPVFQNGVPKFSEANLPLADGLGVVTTNTDRVLFWYCFSKDVDSGFPGKELAPDHKYEIGRPEKVAAKRMAAMNSNSMDSDLIFEKTRMSYSDVKKIMEILQMDISGIEDADRFHVRDNADKAKYEVAKNSVLKNMPKYDLTETAKMVKDAKSQGVVSKDSGWWMLHKSDTVKEKIVEVQGQKEKDQDFAFAEFLGTNPAAVELIMSYMQ